MYFSPKIHVLVNNQYDIFYKSVGLLYIFNSKLKHKVYPHNNKTYLLSHPIRFISIIDLYPSRFIMLKTLFSYPLLL